MFQYNRQHNFVASEIKHFPFATRPFFKIGGNTIVANAETLVYSFLNGSDFIHLYSYGTMQDFVDTASFRLLVRANNEIVGRNYGRRVWHRIPTEEQYCYYGKIPPRALVSVSLENNSATTFDSTIWIAGVYSKFKDAII